MSVEQCERRGCNVECCSRKSETYGYICDSCFEELVSCGLDTDIGWFMNKTRPGERPAESVRKEFEEMFPTSAERVAAQQEG